ncbi:hypothetical protein HN011_006446 [Eciton burchellii]|nr:hypothetical protein HN011_006446 [Eciton burchellii]
MARFPPLNLYGHWLNEGHATMMNNGNSAQVMLGGDRSPSTVSGGPLVGEYEFHSAHFHWGEDNCRGAEHMINGTWFSMESHFLHWNRKYLNFEDSLKYRDGLCTLSYLFLVQPGICDSSDVRFGRISDNLKHIEQAESETKIPPNSLYWMRRATNCSRYYTYPGSHNKTEAEKYNPECATWIVFPCVIPIQACQINEFRKLKDKHGECIKANWRKTQHLRGRQIFLAVP